jgi:Ca2+-binding RTX toxin-like protein
VEYLLFAGTGDFDGTGNELANSITSGVGDDTLIGGAGDDTLRGGEGDDKVIGGAGDDRLYGNDGNDTVVGGSGSNVLIGDWGGDWFVLADPGLAFNRILDFASGEDMLVVSAADFDGLIPGDALSTAQFTTGRSATGSEAQFIFRNKNVWWDADGDGAGEAVLLARFASGTLAASDIIIIA